MTQQNRFLNIVFLLFFVLFSLKIHAQAVPKRELRGVWIASVMNIDYPLTPSTDANYLKQSWYDLIRKHKSMGLNAIFVQVRPTSDAFYKSKLAPWSRYLTGQSGLAPSNDFDPLSFMVSTAHQMGMEFHAWLNPYRASMDNQMPESFDSTHVMRQHPDWCIKYGKRYIMNPGLPEVRSHVVDVVTELVRNYDVDGIHFDDYFYPYKIAGETFNDYAAFQTYNNGFTNIEDWRRNNVDILIYNIYKSIKSIKPRVQFGISPFGVWRNQSKDPNGSATQAGITCYDDLYADVLKWMREGWIDYVMPQVYWQIGFSIADYETIVRWWERNSYGRPVYVGHGAYRIGQASNREPNWGDPRELPRQITLNRSLKGVKGSVFFSSKSLTNNLLGIADTLRNNFYSYPTITPEVIKDTTSLVCEPPEIRAYSTVNGRVTLRWKKSQLAQTNNQAHQYIIYRFHPDKIDFSNGRNIIAIVPQTTNEYTFFDPNTTEDDAYLYSVASSDCIRDILPKDIVSSLPQVNSKTVKVNHVRKKHKKSLFKRFWHWLF